MIIVWSALSIAGLLLVWAGALRSQHLVVLFWPRHGLVLLERRGGERYQIVGPLWMPLVLLRYLGVSAMALVHEGQRRVSAWVHAHGHRHRHTAAGVKA